MEGGFLTPKPTPRARRAKRRGANCPTLKDLTLAALVEALDGEANESSSLKLLVKVENIKVRKLDFDD